MSLDAKTRMLPAVNWRRAPETNQQPAKANMNIQYQSHGLPLCAVAARPMDEHLERLNRLVPITSGQVLLEHLPDTAPAFCATAYLLIPGPDIHAAARDHTLEAALVKVARRLEEQIKARKDRQQLRLNRRRTVEPCPVSQQIVSVNTKGGH